MFSVMQSSRTLREAMTKKGRCSVSGNGPLMFPRQLDVVADDLFMFDLTMEATFSGSAGKNRNLPSTTRFFATKLQVAEA